MAESTQEEPRSVGRPLLFSSVEELDRKIDAYFGSREPHIIKVQTKIQKQDGTHYWGETEEMTEQRPITITGLAVYLGTSRQTLLSYKERPEFLDSIRNALARCEQYAEEQLFEGRNANGAKFSLQNNYQWEDKITQKHEGGFFDGSRRLEVEIVNPEQPPSDPETSTEPNTEPSA